MSGDLDYFGADEADTTLDDVRAGRAVLKKGDKGEAVTYVQALAGAVADGDYGTKTVDAVKAFQKAHGLSADGVVGKDTLAALDKLAGRAPASQEPVASRDAAQGGSRGTNGMSRERPADVLSPPKKKTSPVVYGGIALGVAAAVGGGAWLLTR